jgi:hypothetical protein
MLAIKSMFKRFCIIAVFASLVACDELGVNFPTQLNANYNGVHSLEQQLDINAENSKTTLDYAPVITSDSPQEILPAPKVGMMEDEHLTIIRNLAPNQNATSRDGKKITILNAYEAASGELCKKVNIQDLNVEETPAVNKPVKNVEVIEKKEGFLHIDNLPKNPEEAAQAVPEIQIFAEKQPVTACFTKNDSLFLPENVVYNQGGI